jgi:hypothetical protein
MMAGCRVSSSSHLSNSQATGYSFSPVPDSLLWVQCDTVNQICSLLLKVDLHYDYMKLARLNATIYWSMLAFSSEVSKRVLDWAVVAIDLSDSCYYICNDSGGIVVKEFAT